MLHYQTQWVDKIQTPSIIKTHDGERYKWSVGVLNATHTWSHTAHQKANYWTCNWFPCHNPPTLCLEQIVSLSNPKMAQLFVNMLYKSLHVIMGKTSLTFIHHSTLVEGNYLAIFTTCPYEWLDYIPWVSIWLLPNMQ